MHRLGECDLLGSPLAPRAVLERAVARDRLLGPDEPDLGPLACRDAPTPADRPNDHPRDEPADVLAVEVRERLLEADRRCVPLAPSRPRCGDRPECLARLSERRLACFQSARPVVLAGLEHGYLIAPVVALSRRLLDGIERPLVAVVALHDGGHVLLAVQERTPEHVPDPHVEVDGLDDSPLRAVGGGAGVTGLARVPAAARLQLPAARRAVDEP